MESAISPHLQCPRTLSPRVSPEFTPPYPMYSARVPQELEQVIMASFGVQYDDEAKRPQALAALRHIVDSFDLENGPASHDLSYHVDANGQHNFIALAYWGENASYTQWLESDAVSNWWKSDDRLNDGIGYFRELFAPRVEQIETLYAFTERFPGVGAVMPKASGEVQEHGYWGSMRDRLPLSQTDWMESTGDLRVVSGDPDSRGRVVVRGHDNITLIRSGQEWMQADEKERDLYFDEMLPSLQDGMDFLRDQGKDIGCYSNRFVYSIDVDGNDLDESYNLGHWRSLDQLERWAESHPTHLRIFVTFFDVVEGLVNLRLYHEVSVADGRNQEYEYINCHPETGMMRDAVRA